MYKMFPLQLRSNNFDYLLNAGTDWEESNKFHYLAWRAILQIFSIFRRVEVDDTKCLESFSSLII